MARFSAFFMSLLSLLPFAIAQSQEWGQCKSDSSLIPAVTNNSVGGGMGWTGPTVPLLHEPPSGICNHVSATRRACRER
jgi:hypothetical protein